jgi:hypothetical protein
MPIRGQVGWVGETIRGSKSGEMGGRVSNGWTIVLNLSKTLKSDKKYGILVDAQETEETEETDGSRTIFCGT